MIDENINTESNKFFTLFIRKSSKYLLERYKYCEVI